MKERKNSAGKKTDHKKEKPGAKCKGKSLTIHTCLGRTEIDKRAVHRTSPKRTTIFALAGRITSVNSHTCTYMQNTKSSVAKGKTSETNQFEKVEKKRSNL